MFSREGRVEAFPGKKGSGQSTEAKVGDATTKRGTKCARRRAPSAKGEGRQGTPGPACAPVEKLPPDQPISSRFFASQRDAIQKNPRGSAYSITGVVSAAWSIRTTLGASIHKYGQNPAETQ